MGGGPLCACHSGWVRWHEQSHHPCRGRQSSPVNWRTATFASVASIVLPSGRTLPRRASRLSAGSYYEPVPSDVATNNAAATLRHDSPKVSGCTARGDAIWRVRSRRVGFRRRRPKYSIKCLPAAAYNIGADIGGHGFVFRDMVPDRADEAPSFEALHSSKFRWPSQHSKREAGGERNAHPMPAPSSDAMCSNAAFRAAYRRDVWIVNSNARWVLRPRDSTRSWGAVFRYGTIPVQAWLETGKWSARRLGDATWGSRRCTLSGQLSLWSSVHQEAPDRLYWNVPRRNWSIASRADSTRVCRALVAHPHASMTPAW